MPNADKAFLNLSYRQSAYVLKNSKLHLGIDSLPIHLASIYDIPIIALYSHIMASNANPYWSTSEKVILLESDKKGNRPSYSYEEFPKTIRTIMPETIAESVFKLLNIDTKLNFKTLKIGNSFHIPICEIVPNFIAQLEDQKNNTIYIRSDLHFNDQNIAFWCHNYKSVIITDREIPLPLVHQFSNNIQNIFFKLKPENIDIEYFYKLKNTKVKFSLCTDDEENLPYLRNKYFDFIVEYDDQKEKIKNIEKINGKFMTNKILISDGKVYSSESHLKKEKTIDMDNNVIYDDDIFWKDVEHYYIYE